MKLVRPNVYETVFALAGARLVVVADLSATPKTLTATDNDIAFNSRISRRGPQIISA